MTAPDFVTEAEASEDQLDAIRILIEETRDLEAMRRDLTDRLEATEGRLKELSRNILPEMMATAGLASLTIEAEGNLPAYTAKAAPYYRAHIASDWEPERRQEAFRLLTELGASDLIKSEVKVKFDRGSHAAAERFAVEAENRGLPTSLEENVHWKTLTGWLKEETERGTQIPLDTIGGVVGRIVTLKKEKT